MAGGLMGMSTNKLVIIYTLIYGTIA